MGKFWGVYDEHSSLVANFHNLSTGNILPQFHWSLMIYLIRLFVLKIMRMFLTKFTMICLTLIGIGIPNMSMKVIASLSTGHHL